MSNPASIKFTFWMMWPFAVFIVLFFVPASLWFEVDYYEVTDAATAAEVRVIYEREIDFNFIGSYAANIRNERGEQACPPGSETISYSTDAVLPDQINIEWWIGHGLCNDLPPGSYDMTTQWTIQTPWGLPKFSPVYNDDFTIGSVATEQLMEQQIVIEELSRSIEVLKQEVEDSK